MASLKHNTKGIDNLAKSLKNLASTELAIGVFQGAGYSERSNIPLAQLLAMHEVSDGTSFPRRPVLRISAKEYGVNWGTQASKDLGKMLENTKFKRVASYTKIQQTLRPTAKQAKKDVKSVFGSTKLARNAPATVESKGFNKPMIESGKLRKAVFAKIRRK